MEEILPREEETAGQHREQDLKKEMGWKGQTNFCYTVVIVMISHKHDTVLTASLKTWKRTKGYRRLRKQIGRSLLV